MRRPAAVAGLLLSFCALDAERAGAQDVVIQVVNGANELGEPTAAALLEGLDPETALVVCSATLVGCDVAISAGHCFNGQNAPLRQTLFFQHAGFYAIESAVRHPVYEDFIENGIGEFYEVTRQEDISLIKLETPVSGITPATINAIQKPGAGTPGKVVAFGRDPVDEISSFQQNAGIKRSGTMALGVCQDPTLSPWDVLCWQPTAPLGPPGQNVSTCNIDSGGPLYVTFVDERVVAGLTKGAILTSGSCQPPVEAYDTNVFRHRAWIAQAAADAGAMPLDLKVCSALPQLGEQAEPSGCDALPWDPGERTRLCGFQGTLSNSVQTQAHVFQVPEGSGRLRVALNGISRNVNPVDVDFYVRFGAPATPAENDCAADASGSFAFCEFVSPEAGSWHVLAAQGSGTVEYQVVVTQFAAPPPPGVPALGPGLRLLLAGCLALAAAVAAGRWRRP